jgi:hypothetical protein
MARIVVGFEGSCPQSREGIREEGGNRFTIFPSWRPGPGISEEAVGRTTRLGFRVVNESGQDETVTLRIDWQYDDAPPGAERVGNREVYLSYRDFVVVQESGQEAWRTVMGEVEGSVVTFDLRTPPGQMEVHWHPPYTYTQSEAFVAALKGHPLAQAEPLGKSQEGRNLWLLKITDRSTRPKTPALINARFHAYESASSYAMEGAVRWLLSDDAWAADALHRYVFHVIPMANPDGVVNGLGRLTAPQGADLIMSTTAPDSAHRAIWEAADRIRPRLFIDLHNWQNKHRDGLLGLEPHLRERFLKFMPDQVAFGKQWHIRDARPVTGDRPGRELLGAYCRREFGTVTVCFEFPWFGRTPQDLQETGRQALKALMRALDEPTPGTWLYDPTPGDTFSLSGHWGPRP